MGRQVVLRFCLLAHLCLCIAVRGALRCIWEGIWASHLGHAGMHIGGCTGLGASACAYVCVAACVTPFLHQVSSTIVCLCVLLRVCVCYVLCVVCLFVRAAVFAFMCESTIGVSAVCLFSLWSCGALLSGTGVIAG